MALPPNLPAEGGAARRALAALSPACFGMVMATGIVSLAAWLMEMPSLAQGLFYLNIVLYVGLWAFTLARASLCSKLFFGQWADHSQGWGFLTAVAATGIVGEQFLFLAGWNQVAWVLWGLTLALWGVLMYAVLIALILKAEKPPLQRGIHGGWLLAVVATQAVASLSISLSPHAGNQYGAPLAFLALAMWLLGGMLYILMMSLIFYRLVFFTLEPQDWVPPYWINMGAMAISVLVGSTLILQAPDAPHLAAILVFLKGFTVFYWAAGTWWIPVLIVVQVWRHGVRRYPLRYDVLYWSAVFPLGMYAASTHQMDVALELGFLIPLAYGFLYVAMLAWGVTFLAWALSTGRWLNQTAKAYDQNSTDP